MWNLVQELQRTVSRLQSQLDEEKTPAATSSQDEEEFDGDYQPPFYSLQSEDEEDRQIRRFFMNNQKVFTFPNTSWPFVDLKSGL